MLKIPYDFEYISLVKNGKVCIHLDEFCYIHTSLKLNLTYKDALRRRRNASEIT